MKKRLFRRGQFEMIGLVLVVLLLAIGIVLYLQFAVKDNGTENRGAVRGSNSLLVAISETTVPQCGISVQELARDCVLRTNVCLNPCDRARDSLTMLANASLGTRYKYNLSIEGTDVSIVSDCQSGAEKNNVTQWYEQPLAGLANSKLILSICR